MNTDETLNARIRNKLTLYQNVIKLMDDYQHTEGEDKRKQILVPMMKGKEHLEGVYP